MATLAPDSNEAKQIDAALQEWRQGDLALDELRFVHVGDRARPLTAAVSEAASEAVSEAADDEVQAFMSEVKGLAMLTQTCDIVRGCTSRPFVEVAPLIKVGDDDYHNVKKGRRPALAALPSLEAERLVVDLDRVMTIEKSIVVSWSRTPGYDKDADARIFAQALGVEHKRWGVSEQHNLC